MTENEKKKAAKAFADYWADKGYEKGQSQSFWLSLLRDIFGVVEAASSSLVTQTRGLLKSHKKRTKS